jgi:hypothetical protein
MEIDPKFLTEDMYHKGINFIHTEEFFDRVKEEVESGWNSWPLRIEHTRPEMDEVYEHIEHLGMMCISQIPVLEEVHGQYSAGYLNTLIPMYIADTIVDKHRIPEGLREIVETYMNTKYSPELIEQIKLFAYPINIDGYRENVGEDPDYYTYEDPQDYEIIEDTYANENEV